MGPLEFCILLFSDEYIACKGTIVRVHRAEEGSEQRGCCDMLRVKLNQNVQRSLHKEAGASSSGRTTSLEELKALLNRSSHNFSESNLWT